MRTFGVISAWVSIAAIICGLSSIDNFTFVDSIEGCLIQLLIPLISLNMVVCTSTANSIFKYMENHDADKDDVTALINEMKQSLIAQFVGIAVIVLVKSGSFLFKTSVLVFIHHTISISVLVMYVWLIFDIALAYFKVLEGKNA